MFNFRLPRIKTLWLRAWIVASITWAAAAAWSGLPITATAPSFEAVESKLHPSITNLRQRCTRYNQHAEVTMADGPLVLCFRSQAERDVYFKWLSMSSDKYARESRKEEVTKQVARAFSGFVFLALGIFAFDWILRGAGKGFLFAEQGSKQFSGADFFLSKLKTDRIQAAIPITAFVGILWATLRIVANWDMVRRGLDAFGPEAAGPFFLSGFIVLLYRKHLHPLVTIGALLIYIPPAALLFYLPLKSGGLDFLLIPFGIACTELAKFLGSNLRLSNLKFSTFGWQLFIYTASYLAALMIFSVFVYS